MQKNREEILELARKECARMPKWKIEHMRINEMANGFMIKPENASKEWKRRNKWKP